MYLFDLNVSKYSPRSVVKEKDFYNSLENNCVHEPRL